MAGRGMALTRPAWMKHAEEAKVKDEEEKAAAARAAFDATFRDVEGQAGGAPPMELGSDSEGEDVDRLANKPIGPVDPGKCTAAGTGVGGGAAGAAASFVVVTKDSDGRRILHGGAYIRVRVIPGAGVGGVEQDAVVKDHADGTYTATYAVAKRGDYMVSVECNGHPISGSPFPVFFSGGNVPLGVGLIPTSAPMLGASPFLGVGQPMNMGPFSMQGMFSGMLGLLSGVVTGASGGAVLPGLGAAFGEVCRDYLNGRCGRPDCKYNHPPQNQLMTALAAGSTMGGLSQMPMAPSAAAMAAAQSIAAANAFQAAQAAQQQQQQQAGLEDGDGKDEDEDNHEPICTVHVTNLNPILTADQLQQLFAFCGTVVDCSMSDSKTSAYVEYSKPEGAKAGLALNDMPVGGQKLKVELKRKPRAGKAAGNGSSMNGMGPPQLPIMMQQAVVMQQMQFQQALYMQHAMASQQAAARAATLKSAAEMASARAAEISKHLAGPNDGTEAAGAAETGKASPRTRSKSKSRSPSSRFRRDRRSRSGTPARLRRRRVRSRSRDRNHFQSRDRGSYYRGGRDPNPWRLSRRDRDREIEQERREYYSSRSSQRGRDRSWRRSRSRSGSRSRSHRERTPSPRRHRTYESDHRGSGRSARRTRSRSKETRKSRSRSRSGSHGRGRYSPKDVKEIRSHSAVKEGTQSPKRKGGSGAVRGDRKEAERERSGKMDQLHTESAVKNILLENGVSATKSIVVDEVVMEVKSSLTTKLGPAIILKDLERMQQLEDSSNDAPVDVPSSEAGEGAEMKGFKKPVKKGSKERTSTVEDGSEEEETEVVDDWRNDIKSEKPKSKDKKERPVSRPSKDEEERLDASPVRRDMRNGKDHDHGRDASKRSGVWTEVQKETVKEVDVQGQAIESKLSVQPVNGANHRSRRVTETVAIATTELINEKKTNVAAEKLVSTDIRELKVVQEAETDDIFVVENVTQSKVVEELEKTFVEKDSLDGHADEHMNVETKVTEASVPGIDGVSPDAEGDDIEQPSKKVVEGEKSRERRGRKKAEETKEEEVVEKRRKKKHQEAAAGDEGDEQERRRERHRRHNKKHRSEEIVEKGEDEDEEKEDAEQRKERRRHKSRKHKKDDVEKREKKRRKHRHHRRKRSPSESPEASPSGGDKVNDDDDDATKQKNRNSERSPSVKAEKDGVESDKGATRKKSTSRSHKKKRGEPSKSASESPSSSE